MSGTSSAGGAGVPPQLDTSEAHSARVWNYLLGGKDNFAADRATGDQILQMFPGIAHIARVQRRFLARAVRYLAAEAGITQFLDIGTGLPTANNTHQVAQQIAPHVQDRLRRQRPPRAGARRGPADQRARRRHQLHRGRRAGPGRDLADAARTLDFSQPVALMLLGILGQVDDSDEPGSIVSWLLDALPPGSYLALSDGTDTNPELNQAIAIYNQNSASSYHLRSPNRIAGFFAGLDLVPPGVVTTSRWRPDVRDAEEEPREIDAIGGVGRKP